MSEPEPTLTKEQFKQAIEKLANLTPYGQSILGVWIQNTDLDTPLIHYYSDATTTGLLFTIHMLLSDLSYRLTHTPGSAEMFKEFTDYINVFTDSLGPWIKTFKKLDDKGREAMSN